MSAKVLGLLTVLAAIAWCPGPAPAAVTASRYLLVEDDFGEYDECYGYDRTASMVVSASPDSRGPILRGLDSWLAYSADDFLDDGTSFAWERGRALWFGDLLTGRSRRLGAAATSDGFGSFEVGTAGRTALLEDTSSEPSHMILISWNGRRFVQRRVAKAGEPFGLSADGRFAWYRVDTNNDAIAVRAVDGGPAMRLNGVDHASWSPAGSNLAYAIGDSLRVRRMPGGTTHQVTLPSDEDFDEAPSWSPDGKFLFYDGAVVDVAAGRLVALAAFPADASFEWLQTHRHLLLRTAYEDRTHTLVDLLNVRARTELWRHRLQDPWSSPDGRFLRLGGVTPRLVATTSGRAVHLPASFRRRWGLHPSWLNEHALAFQGTRILRVARPPSWTPRVVARAGAGQSLFARGMITATPAGLRLLAHAFAARAHASDCAR